MGYHLEYAVLAMVLILAAFFVFFLKNLRAELVLFITFGIFSFVLFKQSFVRSDLHVTAFFAIFPGLVSLLLLFNKETSRFKASAATAICLCCLAVGFGFGAYNNPLGRLNYPASIFSPAADSDAFQNSFSRFAFPSDVRQTIGPKTVDIIPWNINYLYFNNLNYNPRPVIQSYTVYTPYLVNLNKQKYDGDSAPEFVIFSSQTIDNRYAPFDDQEAKLSLIKNYGAAAALEFSRPAEEIIALDQDHLLKDSNKTYFIKADINYSFFGKVVRFLFKPSQLFIAFTLEDGTVRLHRLVAPVLKTGVVINPLIENEADFLDFAGGVRGRGGSRPPENKRIKSFKIMVDSPSATVKRIASATYEAEIKLSVQEMIIKRND
jgi:hypothetical protein